MGDGWHCKPFLILYCLSMAGGLLFILVGTRDHRLSNGQ